MGTEVTGKCQEFGCRTEAKRLGWGGGWQAREGGDGECVSVAAGRALAQRAYSGVSHTQGGRERKGWEPCGRQPPAEAEECGNQSGFGWRLGSPALKWGQQSPPTRGWGGRTPGTLGTCMNPEAQSHLLNGSHDSCREQRF